MDIIEDLEIPLILGRPFMLTAECVVDMGRKKMEMGFEDQKINFDLFEEDKPATNQNVCLQVKKCEEEVLKVRIKICVKLMTLKKRFLGGNPVQIFFTFYFVALHGLELTHNSCIREYQLVLYWKIGVT